jgi:MYXO-CTERM domain-containing protein
VAPFACLTLALCAVGCGQLPAAGTTATEDPIFGGTPDNTDDAVMALINQITTSTSDECSGTTIALSGASGIFLTAAHCVVLNANGMVTKPVTRADTANLYIVPGPNWHTSVAAGLYYGVADIAIPPQYDGSVDSPYDIGLVRFLGALPATPVIPVLTPAEDTLTVGSGITVVGFGKTENDTAQNPNAQRLEVTRVIQSITANQFIYSQTDSKGACQGDSGGPALVSTPGGLRVGGTTSFGDPNCTMEGASVRVSALNAFIQGFINAVPQTLSCDDCALAAVGPGNACVNQSITCGQSTSSCGKFVACAQACGTDSCVTQCRRTNAAGATAYDAIVTCQCGGMCTTPCAANTVCAGSGGLTGAGGAGGSSGGAAGSAGSSGTAGASGTTGSGGSSGAAGGTSGSSFECQDFTDTRPLCQSCMQGSCCAQLTACAGDTDCTACRIESSSPSCATNVAFTKLTQCLASCQNAPCSGAGAAPDGGSASSPTGGSSTGPAAAGKSGCSCDVGPAPGGGLGLGTLFALGLVASRSRRASRSRVRRG